MATLQGSGTQPPGGPSSSQPSGRQNFKPPKDEQLNQAKSQLEHVQARRSVVFQYSAANDPTSAANTIRQAPRMCGRNTISYLHYLDKNIKLAVSKIDSYRSHLESGVTLLSSQMSSYAGDLDRKIQMLKACKDIHAKVLLDLERLKEEQDQARDVNVTIQLLKDSQDYVVREIEYLHASKQYRENDFTTLMKSWKADTSLDAHELDMKMKNLTVMKDHSDRCVDMQIMELNAKQIKYTSDLDKYTRLLNAENNSHADELDKQIKLLCTKQNVLARELVRQFTLLNAKNNTYSQDLVRRIYSLHDEITSHHHDIRRRSELVDSRKAPFVHDLDGQLTLLASKVASFEHEFRQQEDLLASNTDRYFTDVSQKMMLMNSDTSSYFYRNNIPHLKLHT